MVYCSGKIALKFALANQLVVLPYDHALPWVLWNLKKNA